MIEVEVHYRRQNRQTVINGTVEALDFAWVARSRAGHGTTIDGSWGEERITVDMLERRVGTGMATLSGAIGSDIVSLTISHHLHLGLDATGTIGTCDIALRLDRPVGSRRRIVHRQPQPDVALQVTWQNLGGTLHGRVTRIEDAIAATLVGLASADAR